MSNELAAELKSEWGDDAKVGPWAVKGEEGHKKALDLWRRLKEYGAARMPDPMDGPT